MTKKAYLKTLQEAFKALYGVEAKYLETVPVVETFQGAPVWEGEVEVFELSGHPKATKGYAWSYQREGKPDKITAVLELPPVISPKTAVQAAIVAEAKKKP